MNLIEAIKNGGPFRRPGWTIEAIMDEGGRMHRPDDPGHEVSLSRYEYLADDWEIESKVTITKTQFWAAFHHASDHYVGEGLVADMAKRLGLEP